MKRNLFSTLPTYAIGLVVLTLIVCSTPASVRSDDGTGVPQDMAYVSFGPFLMGIDREAPDAKKTKAQQTLYERRMDKPWSAEAFHDEGPARWVVLDAYYIDKYEVSNKQFGEFLRATGHAAPAYWDDPRLNKANQPVVGVNWFDAKAYCEWKGKRLPTEAEWEKAARGPEGLKYPWGNEYDASKVNVGKNHKSTLPVDSMPEAASHYGAHHMSGNVFEWVSDWYDPKFYEKTTQVENPTGPEKPVWLGGTGTYVDRLTTGEKRVIRGGSWIAVKSSTTTTHRFWNHPMNNSYGVGLGFRCAKNAPANVDDMIRDAYIAAFVSMGGERFKEAQTHIEKALQLAPDDKQLLEVRDLIQASMKRAAKS